MDDVGEPTVTIELALRWATLPAGVGHAYPSQRMRAVRGFARYLHGIDPSSEVPPLPLLPARKHRPTPHIYTDWEVAAMMATARALLPPLRAATMETLIGLLASTGIRDSEAFALGRTDIDRTNRLLRIRDSKYGNSREVLVHDSTIAKLDAYLTRRDQLRAGGDRTCVFVSCWGARLSHRSVHRSFGPIRQASGVTRSASGHRPRLHDLRHTFAVNTLVGWYRNGENVAAKLPLLSSYLGHVDPAATYWYLSAVPELLALAAQRSSSTTTTTPQRLIGRSRCCCASRSASATGARGGPGDERAGPDAPGVLYRAAHRSAPSQPAHDRRVPRHVPPAARLRPAAHRDRAAQARHRRSRRPP